MDPSFSQHPQTEPGDKAARVRQAVFLFLSRRNNGESVTTDAFAAGYPDLLPELKTALERGVRQLRQAQEVERFQGPPDTPVPPSHDDDPSDKLALGEPALGYRPIVRGYQLQREISGGAQGTVFEAIQQSTGRTVAVKIMAGVSRSSAARFEREVHALASVNHRGVVGIIDRGRTANDSYFLVMDYIAGMNLDEWVNSVRGTDAAQRKIIELFSNIGLAIESAHAIRIVHRDLKPSNIRVAPSGQPCIIDFGLAHLADHLPNRAANNLTQTGNIVGSIPWASPEQAAGIAGEMGPASDVYSLGVLLYQALTGRFPYPVDGPLHHTTRNICEIQPANPRKVADVAIGPIDEALASVLSTCLAKPARARYASGGALSAVLLDYLDGKYKAPKRRLNVPVKVGWAMSLIGGLLLILAASWTFINYTATDPVPLAIQLPTLTNSIGMRFVKIPAGTFSMGSSPREVGHQESEQPHTVRITRSFDLAVTEVTRAQYRKVMGALPPDSGAGPDSLPVDHVSWENAQVFCKKLSALDAKPYRLPTEAEWEYACRAGTKGAYGGSGRLEDVGWFDGNSGSVLHPVATRSPNQWGLYDMHGNVSEWVLDTYTPHIGPDDTSAPDNLSQKHLNVLRGGNFLRSAQECRAASRDPTTPWLTDAGYGFRVAIGPTPDRLQERIKIP